ncbi:MAG: hypothetical protein KY467_14535 [Gemmatimonadetes bacterium]|nr:hypothetical protein [Gemmatimonadota bacterium]
MREVESRSFYGADDRLRMFQTYDERRGDASLEMPRASHRSETASLTRHQAPGSTEMSELKLVVETDALIGPDQGRA